MDILQLKYFIAIVENDLNLSLASKKLHLSQPALSKYILKFEEEENLKLFERKNGRLSGLTFAGENFYNNAKVVVESHTNMLSELREQSKKITGTVRIGIPPAHSYRALHRDHGSADHQQSHHQLHHRGARGL